MSDPLKRSLEVAVQLMKQLLQQLPSKPDTHQAILKNSTEMFIKHHDTDA